MCVCVEIPLAADSRGRNQIFCNDFKTILRRRRYAATGVSHAVSPAMRFFRSPRNEPIARVIFFKRLTRIDAVNTYRPVGVTIIERLVVVETFVRRVHTQTVRTHAVGKQTTGARAHTRPARRRPGHPVPVDETRPFARTGVRRVIVTAAYVYVPCKHCARRHNVFQTGRRRVLRSRTYSRHSAAAVVEQ